MNNHCHLKKCEHKDICGIFPHREDFCPIVKRHAILVMRRAGERMAEELNQQSIDVMVTGKIQGTKPMNIA